MHVDRETQQYYHRKYICNKYVYFYCIIADCNASIRINSESNLKKIILPHKEHKNSEISYTLEVLKLKVVQQKEIVEYVNVNSIQCFEYTVTLQQFYKDMNVWRQLDKIINGCNNGSVLYAAQKSIDNYHTAIAVKHCLLFQKPDLDIFLLSGVHGLDHGENWRFYLENFYSQCVERYKDTLTEPKFFHYDEKVYVNQRIKIIDISNMELGEFKRILVSKAHVIASFCYGIRDRNIRKILGLPNRLYYD